MRGREMATWSKVKQQMEGFLAESLSERIQYAASSYRYLKDKPGQCYLKADGVEVFALKRQVEGITWYQNEQEIKKQQNIICYASSEEIDTLHAAKPKIPEERLRVIIVDQKVTECAKLIYEAQNQLLKSDFMNKAAEYMASSLEKSIEGNDILLNVFALIDRRMGKSRLRKLRDKMTQKHPVVQYFYQMRCQAERI